MRMMKLAVVVAAGLMLFPSVVSAQNTTSLASLYLMVGGPEHEQYLSDSVTSRWYATQVRNGRSYRAEVVQGRTEDTQANPTLGVYQTDGTTLIGSNNAVDTEPDALDLSRFCFQATGLTGATPTIKWKITDSTAGTVYYRTRIIETTLWASWFFVGGDYNSFLLLRNTTDSPVNYSVRWRNPLGAEVGYGWGMVGANSALGINARTYIADPVTNFNGTVEVTHDGSGEALVGQVTSLSATAGLGYDSMLFQRRPW